MFVGVLAGLHQHAQAQVALQKKTLQESKIKLNIMENKNAEIYAKIQEEVKFQNKQSGDASWYDYTLPSGWSSVGHKVCAARDYPRGAVLRVYSPGRGSVDCQVTDYGPDAKVHPERIVDLSSTAFAKLSPLSKGVIKIQVWRIK